ncbi:MAG: hypothetical protein UT77_C0016G0016 [Candidatus Daviesbacteria bacterium GW2011_GWC2_40_12]|uniref:Uncharacterized protein n=1 Tax=Candidatus Daviesbacteria bacterium GW2011_GWC2_40_12 TaxID=1618431 RepID=A0A0G0TT33_9BACT|nr:MAG: hypothetical protein UT77_C0016G0016 [Candidatus Daviesbacteria bacterium GW2011_GWC2_40_12]
MREKCPGPLEISKTLASKPKGATIDRFQINGTLPCGIGVQQQQNTLLSKMQISQQKLSADLEPGKKFLQCGRKELNLHLIAKTAL